MAFPCAIGERCGIEMPQCVVFSVRLAERMQLDQKLRRFRVAVWGFEHRGPLTPRRGRSVWQRSNCCTAAKAIRFSVLHVVRAAARDGPRSVAVNQRRGMAWGDRREGGSYGGE